MRGAICRSSHANLAMEGRQEPQLSDLRMFAWSRSRRTVGQLSQMPGFGRVPATTIRPAYTKARLLRAFFCLTATSPTRQLPRCPLHN